MVLGQTVAAAFKAKMYSKLKNVSIIKAERKVLHPDTHPPYCQFNNRLVPGCLGLMAIIFMYLFIY